jgi:hypothetical protein
LFTLWAIAASGACIAQEAAAEQPRDAGGAMELFDGKSLEGWITESGEPVTEGWAVQDGELVRTERGGAIYYHREFEDFILDFEWKIAPGVNSGLKYRVRHYDVGVRGNPGWLGCEYQIYDDAKDPGPLSSMGALYALYAPNEKKRVNPPGEYNHSRVVVSGTRIEHWLNGEKIVEADTASDDWKNRVAQSKFAPAKDFAQNRRGYIQLQDHGGQIWFRRITLRPLTADKSPQNESR